MIVGILSDTHGHLARTKAACALLLAEQPDLIVHCGDLGSENVLIEMAAAFDPLGISVQAVLGNVDAYQQELIHFPDTTCVRVAEWAELALGDKQAAVLHGHDRTLFEKAINSGIYDYVFTGHTHVRKDETIGTTRVINPGAVYRSNEPGCAVLDTASGALRYLDLMG